MDKLLLAPDSDGYQSTDGEEVIRVALDGGAGLYRLDKIGATKTVQVKWTMNPTQYQYWRAFYLTSTLRGVLPFLCDLLSEDGSGAVEHTCSFIPGSVTMPSQQGLTYVQQAQLEVTPLPVNDLLNAEVVAAFTASDGRPDQLLAAIALLANVMAPEAIGVR